MRKTILILIIAAAFVAGSIVTGTIAFADEPQTFEQACAEELGDDDINLEGLLCQAIFGIQDELDTLSQGVQVDSTTGDVNVGNDLTVAGSVTVGSTIDIDGTNNIIKGSSPGLIFQTDSTERMRITTAGNVGIGTPTPSTKLDVAGTTTATKLDTGQGANELFAMDQNVQTTDSPQFAGLDVSDEPFGLTKLNAVEFTAATNTVIDVLTVAHGVTSGVGADGIGAGLIFRNEVSNSGFSASGAIRGIATDAVLPGTKGVLAFSTLTPTGLSEQMRIDDIGRVGIGTPTPSTKLDVTGTITATKLDTGEGANELFDMNQNVQTTDAVAFATVNTGNGANELFAMDQDVETTDSPSFAGLTVDTNTLFVDTLNNLVGIGTATPNAALHILGPTPQIFLTDSPIAGIGGAIVFKEGGATSGEIFHNTANDDITIRSTQGGTSSIVLDGATANVGIGTDAPTAKLDVAGSMKVDGTTLFVDAANNRVGIGTATPFAALHIVGSSPEIRIDATGSSRPQIDLRQNGITHSEFTWIPSTDDVRITNTGSPSIGAIGTFGMIVIDSTGRVGINTATPGVGLEVAVGGFRVDGPTFNVDATENRVGIGTSAPAEELHVVGNIRATPIVGEWAPNSSTSATAFDFVIFDFQRVNTDTTYFGFVAGTDSIQIKKSGFYRISAHVQTESGSAGEFARWQILTTTSDGTLIDVICRSAFIMAGATYQNDCSVIKFINFNERIKLRDVSNNNSIDGDTLGDSTFLNIEKLN